MATKSMYAPEDWSQRHQRRSQMFRDQHGRRYHATIELKSGHPTGPIEPRFAAPLATPMKYLELSRDPERPYDLSINYDAWLADLRTAHNEWKAEGEKFGRLIYQERYDPNAPFTRQVLEQIGPPPQHVEPVIAAKQGNAYVLGLTDRVDIRLYAMLQEDRKTTQTSGAEPDFSQVVEAEDVDDFDGDDPSLEAAQSAADRELEERRKKDRERKALKRAEAKGQPTQAA